MSISPRDVWPSLPADRRGVILDDLAALLREISHDLGPHHATTPVPQGGDLHSPVHATRKRKPTPTVDGTGRPVQAALAASASLQFQGRSSLSLVASWPMAWAR